MLWSMRRCSGVAISFLRIARNTEKLCIEFSGWIYLRLMVLRVWRMTLCKEQSAFLLLVFSGGDWKRWSMNVPIQFLRFVAMLMSMLSVN